MADTQEDKDIKKENLTDNLTNDQLRYIINHFFNRNLEIGRVDHLRLIYKFNRNDAIQYCKTHKILEYYFKTSND